MPLRGTTIDVHCPVNPELECPQLVALDELYDHQPISEHDTVTRAEQLLSDDHLLAMRVAEHRTAAKVFGCDKIEDEKTCPITVRMAESPVRITVRTIFRKLVGMPTE